MSTLVGLLIVLALLVASAFFVAVEFSLIAVDRSRMEQQAAEGSWRAKAVVKALRRLSFHLSGAQLGITLVSLILGFLAEPLLAKLLDPVLEPFVGTGSTLSIILALVFATVAQMVLGELIPKNLAIAGPDRTALLLSAAARVVHGALSPIIIVFEGAANWAVRMLGMEPQEEMHQYRTIEELELLIRSSGDSGTLDPEAHSMLTRTLRFGDKTAADALTPRVDVEAVCITASLAELVEEVGRSRHSNYLVFGEDIDDVRGIASITPLFGVPVDELAERKVSSLMDEEPLFVPETKDLIDLLEEFKQVTSEMAVVVDEHGGTAGIVTLEDVLEEIVGDVDDEDDDPQTLTAGAVDGMYVAAGTVSPDELADLSGLVLPDGPYETVAGFVLARLGRIPVAGAEVRYDSWTLRVAEMDDRRIASLQVMAPSRGRLSIGAREAHDSH